MRTAIITGASTGIGRATAIALAKNEYHVYLIGRARQGLEETARLITELKIGQSTTIATDLSSVESVNQLIVTIKTKEHQIDAIINIAGIWHGENEVYAGKNFAEFEQKIILDTYTVGLTAPTLIIHGLLPLMTAGARVVNLSGTFENGAKGWLPYYVSKRAIEDLTIGLSQELRGQNIFVNCVSPSDTATEQYKKYFPEDAQDAISPENIAEQIVTLCDYSYTETGKVIVVKAGHNATNIFHA